VFAGDVEVAADEHGADREWQDSFRVCDTQAPLLFLSAQSCNNTTRWSKNNSIRNWL